MNSTVEFKDDQDRSRTLTLVYPDVADIEKARISILTPIGAALIGLTEGQSISWTDRSGGLHRLEVITVEQVPVGPQHVDKSRL
ncbi:GreA/GreB family elongation factor [Pelagibacterium sp. H642]|uniref:GreA/GreB family elongation factor n=1 Tax=Pelagibacterium sp. H642 TaxID=1881069 RepID=UPI0028151CA3|nr:GreA/GreB family elongation factor [Pelagibacterium sp. H642]WMT92896.1 GreA/GreB family elongation factor [Pelagibacterium sp. H642]